MITHRVVCVCAALVCVLGCGGSSEPTMSAATSDRDRDGFTTASGDCDDQNAAVNPNGSVVAASCSWQSSQWDCPRGSEKSPEDKDSIFVRVANNQCSSLAVADATVHVTVLEAHGTFNQPNEKWTSEHVLFSPKGLPMAVTAEVEVDGDIVCTNPGGGGSYNVVQAEVVLQTGAGPIRCVTSNTHTTRFPVAGETVREAEGLRHGQPAGLPGLAARRR